MRRSVQHATCQPCTTTALDGHVRHGRGTECMRPTHHPAHHAHHAPRRLGQLCSVLICMPRQMTAPYKLATNSIARSKRTRSPILGPSQRCMLPPNNHDDINMNAPHRQHTAYRIQRGVPAARNTQRLQRTVRNAMHNVSQRATPSPDRAAHAHQTPHNELHDRALRDGCAFATCNVQHERCNTPTRADATRNARRCIMQQPCDTHRCNPQRAPVQHAPRKHATCNAHRCNAERAPMQHASMRIDATC
jgi:hypothetical protein